MKTATKADILACTLRVESCTIPGFHMQVYVREMDVEQRVKYLDIVRAAMEEKKPQKGIGTKILLPSLVDKDGKQLFTAEDAQALADVNPRVITTLTNKMLEISGMFPESLVLEKKTLQRIQTIDSASSWLKGLVRRYAR